MNELNRIYRLGLCLSAILAMAQAPASPAPVPHPPIHGGSNQPLPDSCRTCHTCDGPTAGDPCLRPCIRPPSDAAIGATEPLRGPDLVILDELEERYLPVPFDHQGHAKMADMTRGCVVCHHFTPEGAAHPACKNCHEVNHDLGDIRKPGLKGAYHRQCINCHREWSHETACEICHQPKAGLNSTPMVRKIPQKDDIMGLMHPPIPEPETARYHTAYEQGGPTHVTFRHKEHIDRFGFTCAECHQEDSCSRCHEEGKSKANHVKTLEEHHKPCAQCHDVTATDRCSHCHRPEGEPEPPTFDHARTGWPLAPYHLAASCRTCHATVPFAGLSRDCNTCHAAWNTENFAHEITGQILDERHAAAACEDCHIDREFNRPPKCDGCHGEEENVAFPAKRPGPFNVKDSK